MSLRAGPGLGGRHLTTPCLDLWQGEMGGMVIGKNWSGSACPEAGFTG